MTKQNKMQDQSNISLNQYPSIHWEKFFAKFPDIETLEISQWNSNHLIAYFCKRYNTYYGVDYTFRFNSTAPSKSYEVFQMSKLSNMISSNPTILKEYIDWFWDKQIIEKKKRITSMSFMTDIKTVNVYKVQYLTGSNIDRTTKLPQNIIDTSKSYDINISTYGELSFMKHCIDAGSAGDSWKNFLDNIVSNGFNPIILSKIK